MGRSCVFPANPEAMLLASKEATGEIPQSDLDELDAIMAKADGGRAFISTDASGVASIIGVPPPNPGDPSPN